MSIVNVIKSLLKVVLTTKAGNSNASVDVETDIGEKRLIDIYTPAKVAKMFPNLPHVKKNINKYLPCVLEALEDAGLSDKEMVLMALATIRAETEGFEPISEYKSKYNTDPGMHPFNRYDGRFGNKHKEGEKFKGRGFVQLTFKANYQEIGKMIGLGDDLVNYPENANEPHIAAAILAHFIKRNETKIRSALANEDLKAARKVINGGLHSYQNFKDSYLLGKDLF